MKKLLSTLFVALLMIFPAAPVLAVEVIDPVCQNVRGNSLPAVCRDNNQRAGDSLLFGPNGLLTKIINIFSLVLGVAAVIVILISSIRFITSSGDPNTVNQAKNAILFAVIGLIIAVLAQTVVQLVLSKIGG